MAILCHWVWHLCFCLLLWETLLLHFLHNLHLPVNWQLREMFLKSGMAVSTTSKSDKLSPQKHPQRRCVSTLHKSTGLCNVFRCDLFHPGILLVISIPLCQRLLLEHPVGSACSYWSAYSTAVVCIDKKCVRTSGVGEYVGVRSKLSWMFDSYSSVNLIFCFLFLMHQYFRYPNPLLAAYSNLESLYPIRFFWCC